MSFDPKQLQAGDHLIYTGGSFFDLLIRLKTYSRACHIEISCGNGASIASRNNLGVNQYAHRSEGLCYVLRPRSRTLNHSKGMEFFQTVKNRKYGWLDLLRFICIAMPTKGLICSEFAAMYDDAAGIESFNLLWNRGAIAPADFLKSPAFEHLYGLFQ